MTSFLSYLSLSFFICLFAWSSRVDSLGFQHARIRSSGAYLTTEEHWFNQSLDHFSTTDHRLFKQRYFEFYDYYRADGPIFLRICGEYSCDGIANDYSAVLAKKFGAALVSVEHRYYGKSSPFKDLTTENLKYLSSKQALFDLAVFQQYYQKIFNEKYNISSCDSLWFSFGVSYPGALSAWYRLKFPHLTCGSLASSAVVQALYNFTDFDKQVGESAGPECKAVLQEITKLVERQLQADGYNIKNLFGAATIKNDVDFLYLLADAAAIAFQYGNPDLLCNPLVDAKKNSQDLVDTFARYVKEYYVGTYGVPVSTYDQQYLKNTTPEETGSNSQAHFSKVGLPFFDKLFRDARLWWYQVCTEVAYFQVAPQNDSIRSELIDSRYHLDLCKNVFGEGVYPEVDMTNIYYGGTRIGGSRIIFTNGSQDPWRHASKQTSSERMPSFLVKCHNCGHGTDLRGCPQEPSNIEGNASNCTSPEAVEEVRQQIIDTMDLWLSECKSAGQKLVDSA